MTNLEWQSIPPRWVVLDEGGIEGEPLHITGVKWSSGQRSP